MIIQHDYIPTVITFNDHNCLFKLILSKIRCISGTIIYGRIANIVNSQTTQIISFNRVTLKSDENRKRKFTTESLESLIIWCSFQKKFSNADH